MSTADVAAKDFLDARRAKLVWFVGLTYALLIALFFVQVSLGNVDGPSNVLAALWNMAFVGAVFVPAIALVAAYLAIAGERESGSIRYLLSTPVSRRDVVLGKYVSRALVVAASLAVGYASAAVLTVVLFDSFAARTFVGVALLTTTYALAYVAVAVGISAATSSRARAMAGAIGFYFVTNLVTLFDDVSGLAALDYVLNDLLGLGVAGDLIRLVGMLTNPTEAYVVATMLAFPESLHDQLEFPVPETLAWYVQPEVALVILLAWLVVPIWFGLRRFERADID